jgi:hypothetical protein
MSVPATEQRIVKFCPVCRKADTDPRHVILTPDGIVEKHIDCCDSTGCPDESCGTVLESAGEKRGAELLAHIKRNGSAIEEAHKAKVEAKRNGN